MAKSDVEKRGSGWADFATLLFMMGGIFNLIAGIAALVAKGKFAEDDLVYANLKLAAWFWIILAGLQLLSAVLIFRRQPSGRIIGVFLALLGACLWFFFLDARPWWAIVMIAMYTMIMYTLTKYADVFTEGGSLPDQNLSLPKTAAGIGKQFTSDDKS
jgi:hypothetical protein